ncbi:hypothetical protein TNCT_30711, partial [Trichonephila clavata]
MDLSVFFQYSNDKFPAIEIENSFFVNFNFVRYFPKLIVEPLQDTEKQDLPGPGEFPSTIHPTSCTTVIIFYTIAGKFC